jgi:hypothetical protein
MNFNNERPTMKVAELQQFLGQIVNFVEATGASKLAVLVQTVECLEPFKTQELAAFNQFLRVADEYVRTGVLPESVKTSKPRASRGPKTPKLTLAGAIQLFHDLNERATDPTLDSFTIDAEISKFNDLSIAQLKEVAKEINRTVPPHRKKKPEIVAAFKQMIKDQKENYERHQPQPAQTTPAPEPAPASVGMDPGDTL